MGNVLCCSCQLLTGSRVEKLSVDIGQTHLEHIYLADSLTVPVFVTSFGYCQVHRILVDIVSAAANGTAGLGRYPPLKREVTRLFDFGCPYCDRLISFSKKIANIERLSLQYPWPYKSYH